MSFESFTDEFMMQVLRFVFWLAIVLLNLNFWFGINLIKIIGDFLPLSK